MRVELPNGQIAEFPDDTPPAKIREALAKWKPPSFAERAFRTADDVVRGAADAITLGFADEISAAMNALPALIDDRDYGGVYEENLSAERARDKTGSIARLVGQVPGAVIGALAMPQTGPARLGQIGRAVTQAPGMVRGMGAGAAAGGVYGFGSGEGDVGQRLESAAQGATIGAATGAAAPLVAGAVGAGIRQLKGSAAYQRALQRLADRLRRDEITPDQAAAQLRELGPEATFADLGVETRDLGRAVANVPGRAKVVAEELFEARQAGARQRADEAVQAAFGTKGDDYYATLDALDQARKASAANLYEAAYARPIPFTENLERFLDSPFARQSFAKAQRNWQTEQAAAQLAGEAVDQPQWFVKLMTGGTIDDVRAVPNTRVWHYIEQAMDDTLEGFRDQVTGKIPNTTQTRALKKARGALSKHLKDSNPAFREAQDAYAGPSRLRGAMERGRGIFRRDAEITTDELAAMTASEREFYVMGVARAASDIMDNVQEGGNVIRRLVKSPKIRKRLDPAFTDDATRKAFDDAMEREMRFNETRNRLLKGSRTMPLQEDIAGAGIANVLDLAPDALRAAQGSVGAVMGLGARATRPIMDRARAGLTEQTRNALGDVLFTQDPAMQQRIVNDLLARQALRQLSRTGQGAVVRGATIPLVATQNQ